MRWWDGNRWSEHTADSPPAAPFGAPGAGAGGAGAPAGAPPGQAPPASRTSGWAIASLVLGIIGGSVLAIIFGFVARSRIKRSGGTLRGKGLATAGIVLGFAWLALIAVVVVLAATGALEDTNVDEFSGREKEVAEAVDEYEQAVQDEEYDRVCEELFTPAYEARQAATSSSCPQSFRDDEREQAELEVDRILVAGDRASAFVTGGEDEATMVFARVDGRWLIDGILVR